MSLVRISYAYYFLNVCVYSIYVHFYDMVRWEKRSSMQTFINGGIFWRWCECEGGKKDFFYSAALKRHIVFAFVGDLIIFLEFSVSSFIFLPTHSQHTAQFCSSAFYLLFHGDLTCHHHYQCVKMCKERPERQEGKQASFIFSVYSHFIIITIITTLLTCCKYNPYKN